MKEATPPKWMIRLLSRLVNKDLWESIEGDLFEIHQEDLENLSKQRAHLKYLFNGLAFLRYRRLRTTQYSTQGKTLGKTQHTMDLFKNYFKVSWRDLKRNKIFTTINLIGLITGFTACLFILEFVLYETSFDQFHPDSKDIYRVVNDRYQQGELIQHGAITYPMVGPAMVNDLTAVESYTRMTVGARDYVGRENETYIIEDYIWADEHFLSFFNFPLLHGDAKSALDEPYEIVVTQQYAERLIKGNEEIADLIGKPLDFSGGLHCKISGILATVPTNSHLQFDLLISFESMVERSGRGTETSWNWSDFYHYVKLKEGTDHHTVDAQMVDFSNKYLKNGEVSGSEEKFWLQPLHDAHLYSDFEYEIGQISNGKVVWLMLLVACFIVVIAWINFINLSTSRAIERAKEVGIRKSLGALRGHLFYQFLSESILINGLAMMLAFGIVGGLQSFYNGLTGMPLSMTYLLESSIYHIPFPLVFILVFILCLLLVSTYPSFVLSGFKTQEVIKGKLISTGNTIWFRKLLVVVQFAAAIILIAGTMTVYQQIDYMQNQDLGMEMDDTVVFFGPSLVEFDSTFISGISDFKASVMGIPGVQSVTASNRVFSMQMSRDFQIGRANDPNIKNLTSNIIAIDYNFTDHYAIEIIAGRALRKTDHHIDWNKINKLLINQASLKQYGFPTAAAAIGEKLVTRNKSWEIVGVVNDFHQRTLHTPIEPVMMIPAYENNQYYSVKLTEGAGPNVIQQISSVYQQFYPGNHVDYFHMTDYYNANYRSDQQVKQVAQVFTAMAIVIAALGLYGLVLITINKKTKEIAVRKVLGASLHQLLVILGKDFIVLIGLAVLISLPISYFLLTNWLANYEYRVGVQWHTLLLGATSLVVISIITILLQAQSVSKNNPVDSLKCE